MIVLMLQNFKVCGLRRVERKGVLNDLGFGPEVDMKTSHPSSKP